MTGHWLAIDTATDIASVAVGRPPNTAAGAEVRGARRHATDILRLIDFVLRRSDATVAVSAPPTTSILPSGLQARQPGAHER